MPSSSLFQSTSAVGFPFSRWMRSTSARDLVASVSYIGVTGMPVALVKASNTIEENSACIGHYHTGGNPGRAEIDDTQELNYPAIMRAIKATGFKGFVGQEFIPKRQPALDSLKAAVRLCRV